MNHHHHTFLVRLLVSGLVFMGVSGGIYSAVSAVQTTPLPPVAPSSPEVKSLDTVVIYTNKPDALEAALEDKGLEVSDEVVASETRSYIEVDAKLSDERLREVGREEDDIIIGKIAPNYRYGVTRTPNDTYFGQQWNLKKISAPVTWNTQTGDASTVIAVVDSGVLFGQQWGSSSTYTHADFPTTKIWKNTGEQGATASEGATPNCTSRSKALDKSCNNLDDDDNGFIDDWRGWDFMGGFRGSTGACPNYGDGATYADPDEPDYITEDNDPQPYSCDDYYNMEQLNKNHYTSGCGYGSGACAVGHGTSVASVAASASHNAAIVAGVNWNARIMPLRALDGYGYGSSSQIAAAIDYAAAMGADVINLSLTVSSGGNCAITDTLIDAALGRAESAGSTVVAASGNYGTGTVCYPARSSRAIAVGASTSSDTRAYFSSYGSQLDLVAPGSNVPAANASSKAQPGSYASGVYGTSFAAPHVAGAAALLKSMQPELSPSALRARLVGTADKVPAMNSTSRTDKYGYGRLNLYSATANIGSRLPVYRLHNGARKSYFYTASPAERQRAVTAGFRYEGVAFYARKSTQNTHPIYRLYRASTGSHFFTASASERDRAVLRSGYKYEGIGFRVVENDAVERSIYRLYRSSTGTRLLTASAQERAAAVARYGFSSQGTGFRAE